MVMESMAKEDKLELKRVEYLSYRNNSINEYAWIHEGLVFIRIKPSEFGILIMEVYRENQCPWDTDYKYMILKLEIINKTNIEYNDSQLVLLHKYMFHLPPEQMEEILLMLAKLKNVWSWLDLPSFYTITDYADSISQCEISKLDSKDQLNWLGFGLLDIVKSNFEHTHLVFSVNGSLKQILNLRLVSQEIEIKKLSDKAFFLFDKTTQVTYFLVLPNVSQVLLDCIRDLSLNNSPVSSASASSSGIQLLANQPRIEFQDSLKQYFFIGIYDNSGIRFQSYYCAIKAILNCLHHRLEFQFKNMVPFLLYGSTIANLSLPLKSLTLVRSSQMLLLLLNVRDSVLFFWFRFCDRLDLFLQFFTAYSTLFKTNYEALSTAQQAIFKQLGVAPDKSEIYTFISQCGIDDKLPIDSSVVELVSLFSQQKI